MARQQPRGQESANRSGMRDEELESAREAARRGGPEDLMVDGRGGTLPLKDAELPHYYEGRPEPQRKPR